MDFKRLRMDLLALALLAATVFVGMSLAGYDPADPPARNSYPVRTEIANLAGPHGAQVAHYMRHGLGLGAYVLLAMMFSADMRLFNRNTSGDHGIRWVGAAAALGGICAGLQLLARTADPSAFVGSGGYLGAYGAAFLEQHLARTGLLILIGTLTVSGLLLSGDIVILKLLLAVVLSPLKLFTWTVAGTEEESEAEEDSDESAEETDEAEDEEEDDEEEEAPRPAKKTAPRPVAAAAAAVADRRPIKVNPPVVAKSERDEVRERLEAGSAQTVDEYELPDLDLLEEAEEFPYELLAQKAQAAAATLEKTFQDFGLNVRVVEIDTGPVITQFELELEAGLKLSKVTALADDLAIALRVPAVRVVPSIPGKNTVGVEVPNEKQVMVRLKELIEACPEAAEKMRIPIYLGKDVSGRPLVVDLTKMPHLLIAGRTGTGKSVCLNTLIISMLMTRNPDQVKMLMIDPKMVELSPYKRIPHLMHPVITDMKKAEAVLAWAVDKMEERYDLLAKCGVRHLDNYNKLGKEKVLERLGVEADSEEAERIPDSMPYIVIVADEMADMMMTSGKDVEGHIIRLAQKSRAVGIHLVLATQKPTVDVITGLIKSNLPARISFQVASRTDSRVVLDEMGADKLLGNGDMLYLAPSTSHLTRAQGTYVGDEEMSNVIEFFSDLEPQYSAELAQLSSKGGSGKTDSDSLRSRDELYEQAIEVVIREGRGSVSLLQRALGIGYGRGARLIDYMAEDGIVGEYNGSQAREVLYSWEQWEASRSGGVLEEAEV
ncbi:MAG: DNA translocase FtsK 4TM domain-containing protein [Planctomycetaceae bacterium]